eukprot:7952095-Alexandrium_andersonii.AAC.1
MSASLVGSEMCIRDSPRPRPVEQQGAPSRDLGVPPVVLRLDPLERQVLNCLLYTSDAADDM